MEELLIRLSSLPGVTGSFYVGDDKTFVSQTLSASFVKENARKAVLVLAQTFDALSQVAQFNINRMIVNTGGSRLFIRRSEKGFLNLLTDVTADVAVVDAALDGALKEIKLLAGQPARQPARPAAAQPAPPPAMTAAVDRSVLDSIAALCDEALGELGATIHQNQYSDHKLELEKAKLAPEAVMKFCYALQKDASMIIGPTAAKQMAEKMMALLK